ncbi:maltose O-acetyltransferase/hypothetical protein [Jatrophihabitans endophyticus]|uniref:Maltose O-acetyltransferase n=1 Tax=Jatrophihabitans endophyticus TaxID=1206085 RepID=A0A1M5SPN9_9ACTN|nr:DapH/DapD/GlmU-related protein [Jatrophihabitans endophyticus]SHH40519.1 maltose O-acetyltransferase/hypothetical protein [Jatrophihabitans endophyticus]
MGVSGETIRYWLLNAIVNSELVPRHWRVRLMRRCGIELPDDAIVYAGLRLRPGPITFGARPGINRNCLLDPGEAGITIGDDVGIAANVVITAATHHLGGSGKRADGPRSEPVVIEDGCWLGVGAVVLPGVTVRRGCVVGAGGVVASSTEPDGMYVGVPARRVRDLDGTPAAERGLLR